MRSVFIADAHLRKPEDANYQLLLSFLNELHGTTQTLFILGDLFEFWIGYRKTAFPHYVPILDCLQRLSETGVEIVYFEGNHDFHLGHCFTKTLRATVYSKPAILDIDGRRLFICHGDQINAKDYGYRILRFLLHNRLTKALFPLFPSFVAFRIADYLSSRSKEHHETRNSKWDYKAMITDFSTERFKDGCDAVVAAHFHLPFEMTMTNDGSERTILSLGDWMTQFTYGELVNGTLSLQYYTKQTAYSKNAARIQSCT